MRTAVILVLSAMVFAGTAARAEAQSTRRPDLNIFGRGMRDPEQSLSFRASFGANVYDTITPQQEVPGRLLPPDHGWGSIAAASISYNVRLGNLTFDGTTGAFVTYYPGRPDAFRTTVVPGGGLSLGWAWPVTPRTSLTFSSGVRHRPISIEATVPLSGQINRTGDVVDDASMAFVPRDLDLVEGGYLSAQSDVSITHELTRRLSAQGYYGVQRDFTFSAVNAQYGLWTQRAGGSMGFKIFRNLKVRGGYRFEESHFANTPHPYRYSTYDLGIDFGESQGATVQLTRHTTLTLNGGLGAFADVAGTTSLHLTGSALLQHQIGRTWSADLGFDRGLSSGHLLFQAPMLSDTAFAGLNGLLTRGLGFHASATAQRGAVGFVGAGTGVVRITANSGLQMSLNRRLALSLDYTYYKFRFEQGVARPTGVPALSSSQGLSVQLTTGMPLFQRRRSNVTR